MCRSLSPLHLHTYYTHIDHQGLLQAGSTAHRPVVDPGVDGGKVDVGVRVVGNEVLPLARRPCRAACATSGIVLPQPPFEGQYIYPQ